jgi:uncharacterized membrane protein
MALAAIGLAIGMVSLDIYYLTEIPENYEWLFRSQPAGARAILSTVAGSTITVAGVVFSMTIMSVSHATSNYGSRLLLKFLKDRRNQIALGTFISTFIYCLLVLRTVSSAVGGGESAVGYDSFVPHLAVMGALGLALASVAVLIGFIHHVPDTIHIGSVASDRGQELVSRLDLMFPEQGSSQQDLSQQEPTTIVTFSQQVLNSKSGYLQTLDVEGLVAFCAEQNLQARVIKPMGDFVFEGELLLEFEFDAALDTSSKALPTEQEFYSFFGIGAERTPAQDTRYLIEELSQIAVRALSPGINDPFTAITCIDWLGNAVAHVVNRPARAAELLDQNEAVRLFMPIFGFAELSEHIFGQLRPYVVNDISTSLHMAKVIVSILSCSTNALHEKILRQHAKLYLVESRAACHSEQDLERLSTSYSFLNKTI